jgi:CheY-like chemotaxis protein
VSSPPADTAGVASGAPRVVAVGRNRRNLELIAEVLSGEGVPTGTANGLEAFDQMLENAQGLELVLIDLAGFDQRIWERTERLRRMGVPFLVFSAGPRAAWEEKEGLSRGALTVLRKPLGKRELIRIVQGLLGVD